MKKELELRLRLVEGLEVIASISTVLEYDETNEYDEGQVFFQHPVTGEMCEKRHFSWMDWRRYRRIRRIN